MLSADDQIPTAERLLGRSGSSPVAREPNTTRFVVERDGTTVGFPWLATVGHHDLECCVAVDGDRRQRIGDVLNVGLAVKHRGWIRVRAANGGVDREGCHCIALDLVNPATATHDRVDASFETSLRVLHVEAEVILRARRRRQNARRRGCCDQVTTTGNLPWTRLLSRDHSVSIIPDAILVM